MKKRVLLVSCEGFGNGGVQAVMMGIVRNLHDNYDFDALLFTLEKRFYDDEFLSYGGRIFRVPRYEGVNKFKRKLDYYIRGNKIFKQVKIILRDNGPFDIVHCNNEFESAYVLKAAREMNVPIRIAHTHVISEKSNIIANMLNRKRKIIIEEYSTIKIGCSNDACEKFYLNSDDSKVINNSFNEQRFYKKKEEKKNDKLTLLHVGRFNSLKNQIFSLQILIELKKIFPDVKLFFLGDLSGSYYDKVQDLVRENKLCDNVEFYPSDFDIPFLLSRSSAFLLPSRHEGFGIVLVEAQAMGVRCYTSTGVPKSTDCGGVTYIDLDDGAYEWSKKIIKDYLQNNGHHNRYDVSAFTQEKIMELYNKIYKGENI